MSTVASVNLKHPSSASNNIVLDSSGNATFAGTVVMASSFLRNRVINGDMRIDQRNAGASVTLTNTLGYVLDRYRVVALGTSLGFSSQRSTVAPTGFVNSYLATVTSAKTPASTDQCRIDQFIEGVNVADLGWGTAAAQTVTLSFWVRSSVPGTYCVHLGNDGSPTRSFVAQYTINAANTWEYKTITAPGDTSGTWNTGTSYGVGVAFVLGMGSDFTGSTGWQAGARFQTSSQTNWIATNGATFYLTGVQLEVGSAATPFERRLYGQELALCQRYYQWAPFSLSFTASGAGAALQVAVPFQAQMRAVPSFGAIVADPNSTQLASNNSANAFNSTYSSVNQGFATLVSSAAGQSIAIGYRSAASAEL